MKRSLLAAFFFAKNMNLKIRLANSGPLIKQWPHEVLFNSHRLRQLINITFGDLKHEFFNHEHEQKHEH
jgi:hypothetical protein